MKYEEFWGVKMTQGFVFPLNFIIVMCRATKVFKIACVPLSDTCLIYWEKFRRFYFP